MVDRHGALMLQDKAQRPGSVQFSSKCKYEPICRDGHPQLLSPSRESEV
jgi:hypothetical protein